MKQQLKLNESELYSIIEGAVKSLVMEYLPYEGGKVASRRLNQGDAGAFKKYMDYGLDNGWTNDDMSDFQSGIEAGSSVIEDEDFEDLNDSPINNAVDGSLEDDIAFENKRAVKVNESQLFDIIKESVNILLEKFGNTQVGQYQLGRLAARKKQQGDEEGYNNVVNNAKLQWGADRGIGTNQNAFGNGMHVGKNNVKQGYNLAKKGQL